MPGLLFDYLLLSVELFECLSDIHCRTGLILIDMSIGDNEIVYIQRLFWPCRVALQ